jgi:hypothetical protein
MMQHSPGVPFGMPFSSSSTPPPNSWQPGSFARVKSWEYIETPCGQRVFGGGGILHTRP